MLSQKDVDFHACGDMIREVQSFLSRTWNISMHHIERDANVDANQLVKAAIGGMSGYSSRNEAELQMGLT